MKEDQNLKISGGYEATGLFAKTARGFFIFGVIPF